MAKKFFQWITDILNPDSDKDKKNDAAAEGAVVKPVAEPKAEVEEPVEEKPVKKTRSRAKVNEEEAEPAAKKPTTRKRTAKAAAEEETVKPKSAPRRKAAAKSPASEVVAEEKPVVAEHKSLGKNIIEKEATLTNLIIAKLKENSDGNTKFENKELSIYIANDNLFFDALIDNKFEESLIAKLDEQLGVSFGRVRLCSGKPNRDLLTTEIADNIFLHIKSNNLSSTIRKAVIYSVEGYGSLLESCYHLDSEHIKTLPMARYNIGRGKHPIMGVGFPRENHIAIDDNPNCAGAVQNQYVSRAHAHITYSDHGGFILHVEHGGTRAAENRTHVNHRDGKSTEMLSTMITQPLKDGDYIVLGKRVYLLFKQED